MKRNPLRVLLLFLIGLYRRWVSPALPRRCRYYPTCSQYAEQAVRELGVVRGSILAGWRLLRCNPLSRGGFDSLEDRKLFRDHSHPHPHPHPHPHAHAPDARSRRAAA